MRTVKFLISLGFFLALWLGVDPTLITVSYPILMDMVSQVDITQSKKAKNLPYKE
jgi:hypothetical protein